MQTWKAGTRAGATGAPFGKSKQSQQPLQLGVSAMLEADTTDAGSCASDSEQSDSQVSIHSGTKTLQRGFMPPVDELAPVRRQKSRENHAAPLDLFASQSKSISRRGALRAAGHRVLRQLQTSPPSPQGQCDHHDDSPLKPGQSPPMPRFLCSPPVVPESVQKQPTSDLKLGQDVSEAVAAPAKVELTASLCTDGKVFNPSLPLKKRLLFPEPEEARVSFNRHMPLHKRVTEFLLTETKSVLAE